MSITLTEQSDPRGTVRSSREWMKPEVRSERILRTEPYRGGTRQRPTVASPVMLPNHGNLSVPSRAKTQPKARPKKVLEPEPDRGSGRHGSVVAEPVMRQSDRRQHTCNHRSERKSHSYRIFGHPQPRGSNLPTLDMILSPKTK